MTVLPLLLRAALAAAVLPAGPLAAAAGAAPAAGENRGPATREDRPGAPAEESPLGALEERVRAAAEAHPDDPDLALAWVNALSEARRHEAALEAFEALAARWPERAASRALLHGRLLREAGRPEAALAVLDSRLEREPEDGVAHFTRGLALRDLGRAEEADAAFERAAALEPALVAMSLFLRGLARFQAGDEREGQRLLAEARRASGAADLAQRSRRAWGRAPLPAWELVASGGIDWDSNVTLDAGVDLPGLRADKDDFVYAWGGGFTWRPVRRESVTVTLGYRYGETEHEELAAYDQRTHLAFASALLRPWERVALRLDGRFTAVELDSRRYVRVEQAQPSVLWTIGPRAGLLRAYGNFERRRYHDEPILDSLERDGTVVGGGLEHAVALPLRPGAWARLGGRFDRTKTNAERDLFGLDSAYDHDRWGGDLTLYVPLPWRFDVRGGVGLARELYDHRNLFDLLTDDGVGRLDPRKRRDTVIEGRLALGRRLGRFVRLEVGWRGTRRLSNVDVYDYERHVVGFHMTATVH